MQIHQNKGNPKQRRLGFLEAQIVIREEILIVRRKLKIKSHRSKDKLSSNKSKSKLALNCWIKL